MAQAISDGLVLHVNSSASGINASTFRLCAEARDDIPLMDATYTEFDFAVRAKDEELFKILQANVLTDSIVRYTFF